MNKALVQSVVSSLTRRVLGYGAAALAGHGVMLSSSTKAMVLEVGIAAAMSAADVSWSMYDKYGRRWIAAKLEVMTATAEAQADALRKAHAPIPTDAAIAARIPDPKVTAEVVREVTNS